MILPDALSRVSDADYALAVSVLMQSRPERAKHYQALVADNAAELLDEADLFDLLCESRGLSRPSEVLFTYVAVRAAFLRVGLDDRRAADYVATVLLSYGRGDRAWKLASHEDVRYVTLVDLLAEAAAAPDVRAFMLRAHMGNFSLWLSGIFPDHIQHRVRRRGGPDIDYYERMGASGFRSAAGHALARRHGLTELYDQLALDFPRVRVALNRVSDGVFFRNHHTPGRLMRQVTDEFRYPTVN